MFYPPVSNLHCYTFLISTMFENNKEEAALVPDPALKEKYKSYNKALIVCLAVTFLIKLFGLITAVVGGGAAAKVIATGAGIGSLLGLSILILALPVVLISYVASYRKGAYVATGILTALTLSNQIGYLGKAASLGVVTSILLSAAIIGLSIFMYRKMFPKIVAGV